MPMTIAEKQLLTWHARVMLQHARIVSGAYKTRRVYHGTDTSDESKRFTEAELLAEEIATMRRHVEFMDDCTHHTETD